MAAKIKKRSSSARPIEAVGTSTAAFVGTAKRGPADRPIHVQSLADFQRTFGNALPDSGMGDAVQHFFDNGGTDALIVRVASGAQISAPALEGQKRGLWALEKADLFGLLCIPPVQGADIARQTRDAATAYCARRRALFIADPSSSWQSAPQAKAGLRAGFMTRSAHAALFFPLLKAADQRSVAPCGAVAGVLARTDAAQGVWKAAAGRDATLKGVSGPTIALNAAQNAELNELGINCLRSLPGSGTVVWGSRTLAGITQPSPEWKYVPVRRLASLIEESIARGTRWVTFEPNDEPTWAKLRLRVGDFLHGLFKRGAFAGWKVQESYYVKCDRSVMTQGDIDAGLVNIEVGFAPLKPAEFVVIRIQQMTRKLPTVKKRVIALKSGVTGGAWKDLALPAPQLAMLRRLVTEAGRDGARALFVAERAPARKAAEAIARHLGRTLFFVDMGAIVAKYVGETEKQIDKIFDAAEANGAVLFLDEADALFGKRTTIKDSHDRYANAAAGAVLRRLESFGGLAIVASRKKSGLNRRLLRALRSVVAF